jgi:hypothetical protein
MNLILVGNPERKTSFGRAKSRWEDNNKIDFKYGIRNCAALITFG